MDLDYSGTYLAWEIILIVLYPVFQYLRLELGYRGNKTENYANTGIFIGLTLVAIIWQLVMFILQAYVYPLPCHAICVD